MRWQALGSVAVVLVTGCPSPKPPTPPTPPQYTKVVISIIDPNIAAKVPVCSTQVPCEASYVVREGASGTVLATLTVGTTTYTLTPLPPAGTYSYSILVTGKDALGNAISTPTTGTIVIP